MANVKVKGLSDNFFIKLCSLRRNKTWYKMRKLTKFTYNHKLLSKNINGTLVTNIIFFLKDCVSWN